MSAQELGQHQNQLQDDQNLMEVQQYTDEQQQDEDNQIQNQLGQQQGGFNNEQLVLANQELQNVKLQMQNQEENHKQQIIHVETISMMTKYQLVFIKLETSLNKLNQMFKIRENIYKQSAFDKIVKITSEKINQRNLMAKLIYLQMNSKMNKLVGSMQKSLNRSYAQGLGKIQYASRVRNLELRIKQENDKIKRDFMQVLQQKDKEIGQITQQKDDSQNQLWNSKNKEAELQNKLKNREQHIADLSQELSEVKKSKRLTSNEGSSQNQRQIEQRLKELENENYELKEKVFSTENNVSLFIRDMSDMLDSHELSTNIGSEDNISLNNSNAINSNFVQDYSSNQIQNQQYIPQQQAKNKKPVQKIQQQNQQQFNNTKKSNF